MERIVYDDLLKWKASEKRKPLIVNGVRQCGKTYILRKFGEENYQNVAYFNFEGNSDLSSIFERDLDPHRILDDLRLRYHQSITKDTLIIFDEVQFCNNALTSLKYFYENAPEYNLVCAGSLLGVLLSKPLSFPVGKVNFLTMYPMTFLEFLNAAGEGQLCKVIEGHKDEPISEAFVTVLDRMYREYCFTGGMPEAVEAWISTRDPDVVRKIQSEIVRSYESDFAKHAPSKDIPKLTSIWKSIPEQLSKENRKFLFGHAVKGARARDLEDSLQWLVDAGLVIKVSLISRPAVPLSAYSDPSYFKLYFSDIGLLGAMANVPSSSLISGDERFKEFKGGMTENYVLTELLALTKNIPFFWRSGNKAEVDFIHMIQDMIVPIEVKSGRVKRIQSMERYIEEYDPEKAFVISDNNLRIGPVTIVPLSLVWNLKNYI